MARPPKLRLEGRMCQLEQSMLLATKPRYLNYMQSNHLAPHTFPLIPQGRDNGSGSRYNREKGSESWGALCHSCWIPGETCIYQTATRIDLYSMRQKGRSTPGSKLSVKDREDQGEVVCTDREPGIGYRRREWHQ